jgi:hypothetical protein
MPTQPAQRLSPNLETAHRTRRPRSPAKRSEPTPHTRKRDAAQGPDHARRASTETRAPPGSLAEPPPKPAPRLRSSPNTHGKPAPHPEALRGARRKPAPRLRRSRVLRAFGATPTQPATKPLPRNESPTQSPAQVAKLTRRPRKAPPKSRNSRDALATRDKGPPNKGNTTAARDKALPQKERATQTHAPHKRPLPRRPTRPQGLAALVSFSCLGAGALSTEETRQRARFAALAVEGRSRCVRCRREG